ncbi:MAG: hypothetical protein KatS3mg087_1146 [Patescibacteria group bacterium]|nr:MAG: hypothetical protein KatS3mg087_1146 [Patescibacteria group bacterium]
MIIEPRADKIELIASIIPEFDAFIQKLRDATRKMFLEESNKLLEHLDADIIKRAAKILNRKEKLPRYSQIPIEVKAIAEELQYQEALNDEQNACQFCNNTGVVEILDENYLSRNIIKSTSAACFCKIGQKVKEKHEKHFKKINHKLHTFDAFKDKLYIEVFNKENQSEF